MRMDKTYKKKTRANQNNRRLSDHNFSISNSFRSESKQVFERKTVSKIRKRIDLLDCSKISSKMELTVQDHDSVWQFDHTIPCS